MTLIVILVISLEFIAAFAGLYHIKKYKVGTYTKYLVYVLFFVAISELLGTYSLIASDSKFKIFGFIEGTPFQRNYWLHNIQLIITFSFFINYFRIQLKKGFLSKLIKLGVIIYMFSAISNLLIFDVLFTQISRYTYITGSIFLFITILFYYYVLLKSDFILRFNKSLTFYISIGLVIYYLCATPLFIYGSYYTDGNASFNRFYLYTLAIANCIMYTSFTLGFILCKPNQKYY